MIEGDGAGAPAGAPPTREELLAERDALGEAAFAAYRAAGGDTDGRRTWQQFFRPIVSPTWAVVVDRMVREAIDDERAEVHRLNEWINTHAYDKAGFKI